MSDVLSVTIFTGGGELVIRILYPKGSGTGRMRIASRKILLCAKRCLME
jgi:hypothetical protein